PGRFGAAERFRKPVITPAPENGILRAESAMGEFECSAGVVIEAAHQAVVQLKLDTHGVQNILDFFKVVTARFVKKLADARQLFDDRLVLRNLAVEDTQRIDECATLTVAAHLADHRLESLLQSFVISGAIIRAADRV